MWRFQRFFNSIKPIQLFNRYYIYRKAFSTVLHIRTSTILLESLFTGKATGKFFHRVVTVTEKSEVASRRLGKLGGCKLSSGPLDRQKLQKIDWNPTKTTKILGKIRQIFEKWVNIQKITLSTNSSKSGGCMVTPLGIGEPEDRTRRFVNSNHLKTGAQIGGPENRTTKILKLEPLSYISIVYDCRHNIVFFRPNLSPKIA